MKLQQETIVSTTYYSNHFFGYYSICLHSKHLWFGTMSTTGQTVYSFWFGIYGT